MDSKKPVTLQESLNEIRKHNRRDKERKTVRPRDQITEDVFNTLRRLLKRHNLQLVSAKVNLTENRGILDLEPMPEPNAGHR